MVCPITFGALTFGLFVFAETKAQRPLIPLALLSNPSNVGSLLVVLFHGMVYLAQEYYLPLYFQSTLGASPILSGALVLPFIGTEAVMGIVCGVVIHSTGRHLELTYFGCAMMTIGAGLCTLFAATSPISLIIPIEILAGIGSGFLFQTPMIALHAMVSQEDTASATSTLGFVRNIAQALSLVLGGVVFQNSMDAQVPSLLAQGVSTSVTDLLGGGAAAANVMVVNTISDLGQKMAVRNAFAGSLNNSKRFHSFQILSFVFEQIPRRFILGDYESTANLDVVWIMYACLSGVAVISCLFIKNGPLSKEHVETRTGLGDTRSKEWAEIGS